MTAHRPSVAPEATRLQRAPDVLVDRSILEMLSTAEEDFLRFQTSNACEYDRIELGLFFPPRSRSAATMPVILHRDAIRDDRLALESVDPLHTCGDLLRDRRSAVRDSEKRTMHQAAKRIRLIFRETMYRVDRDDGSVRSNRGNT